MRIPSCGPEFPALFPECRLWAMLFLMVHPDWRKWQAGIDTHAEAVGFRHWGRALFSVASFIGLSPESLCIDYE
jgi:hypothetical protein